MSFTIAPGRDPETAFRDAAGEQLAKAIGEIDDTGLDRHAAVHQVRKRCKKLRGLVRLFRAPLEDSRCYEPLNRHVRDTARPLSDLRDAEVLIETYDALMDRFSGRVERRDFANVRRQLTRRRAQLAEAGAPVDARLADARARLAEAQTMVDGARIDAKGFAALEGGLAKTYARARKAMAAAAESGDPDAFHQWRKRAKYHRYHGRLMSKAWPAELEARRDTAKDVSDLLGDGHDLTVLIEVLGGEAARFSPDDPLDRLDALAAERRAELHAAALPLGRQLFAEKPKRFAARMAAYWATAEEAAAADEVPQVHKAA